MRGDVKQRISVSLLICSNSCNLRVRTSEARSLRRKHGPVGDIKFRTEMKRTQMQE